jgi:hypothetical protein
MNAIALPFLDAISSSAIRWRLTEDALVEEGPGWCRLYGRWDRAFGCWTLTEGGLEPCRPDGPFLGRHGIWLEPEGRRDDSWHASRASVAAYFSLIPTPVRRVVARHEGRQWDLLEAIWRDPSVARRLEYGLDG